jgi:hypothetical protein
MTAITQMHPATLLSVGAALRRDALPNRGINPLLQLQPTKPKQAFGVSAPSPINAVVFGEMLILP